MAARTLMLLLALIGIICCFTTNISALDNGLALTPPMGFSSWQRFRCNVDCENYPDTCISEKLYMGIADAMVSRGYLDAGYEYVNIDDCWYNDTRNADTGRLEPNPLRFPSGMKALADYIHAKGLKLGVYQDVGDKTCAGYPGLLGYETIDAQSYAEWTVDYVKVDGCNIDPKLFDEKYPLFERALNATGRPILLSCEWPLYQMEKGIDTDFSAVRSTCNVWRSYHDIVDSFDSLLTTVEYFGGGGGQTFSNWSGPGGWNDPDMLMIGDYGLSLQQSQAQFALWAILAAPLLISADIRQMRPEFEKPILLNKEIISVNQDALGIQGNRIDDGSKNGGIEIWRRPIMPTATVNGQTVYSYALVFWNVPANGYPTKLDTSLAQLGLNDSNGYTITDLYSDSNMNYGLLMPHDTLQLFVEPSGGVVMLKAALNVQQNDDDETVVDADNDDDSAEDPIDSAEMQAGYENARQAWSMLTEQEDKLQQQIGEIDNKNVAAVETAAAGMPSNFVADLPPPLRNRLQMKNYNVQRMRLTQAFFGDRGHDTAAVPVNSKSEFGILPGIYGPHSQSGNDDDNNHIGELKNDSEFYVDNLGMLRRRHEPFRQLYPWSSLQRTTPQPFTVYKSLWQQLLMKLRNTPVSHLLWIFAKLCIVVSIVTSAVIVITTTSPRKSAAAVKKAEHRKKFAEKSSSKIINDDSESGSIPAASSVSARIASAMQRRKDGGKNDDDRILPRDDNDDDVENDDEGYGDTDYKALEAGKYVRL